LGNRDYTRIGQIHNYAPRHINDSDNPFNRATVIIFAFAFEIGKPAHQPAGKFRVNLSDCPAVNFNFVKIGNAAFSHRFSPARVFFHDAF
jgi:hypothetical protein